MAWVPVVGAVGLAGASLSNDAIAVLSEVSDPHKLPLISFSATSAALSSPAQFPYFLRLNPTRSGLCYTYARLIRLFGGPSRKVRILLAGSRWGLDVRRMMMSRGSSENVCETHGFLAVVCACGTGGRWRYW